MGGSTAGVMDAGLLLLIEMGQSYMLLSFLREEPKVNQAQQRCTQRMLLYGAQLRAPLRRAAPS